LPVLESTDNGTPRSALRYRPLNDAARRSIITTAAQPVAQRASRIRPRPADDDLITEWKRGDEACEDEPEVRVTNPVCPTPAADASLKALRTSAARQAGGVSSNHHRVHPLLLLGLGMLTMFLLWQLALACFNWGTNMLNNLRYGYPRTFQTDAVVGQNDSASHPSHFIAINLQGRIEIIEFPGGDGTHARIYMGPQLSGADADTAPVTLQFIDINHNQQPDMVAFFQSSWILFVNAQGSFRAPTAQESQAMAQYLSSHGIS
jgi:hypothetical protein